MFYIQKDNSGILAWKLQINSVIGSFFIKTNCCFRKRMIRRPSLMARIPQFRFLIRWSLFTGMDFPRVRQNWMLRWRGMTVTYIWGCVPLGIIFRERVTRRRVRLINCFIGIAIAVSARYVVLLPCRLRRSRSNVLLANMRFIRQSQQR